MVEHDKVGLEVLSQSINHLLMNIYNAAAAVTGFLRMPIFSISTCTESPGFRNLGGFIANPTPCSSNE